MVGKGEIRFSTYERSANLIKARFNKIKSMVDTLRAAADETPLTQIQIKSLKSYHTELTKKKEDFDSIFQRILEHASEDEAPETVLSRDQDEVNDLYVEVSTTIECLAPLDDPRSPSSQSVVSAQQNPVAQQVKLPQLDLKGFDGDSSQWVSFINLFDATIHNNDSLSCVMKMQYLLSCLTKEPLNLVKSLNISDANYAIAYQLLKDRYHNTRRLSTLHLNSILDLPNASSGNIKTLRDFINLFLEHTQSLKALDCDITTQSNPFLSAHLLRKLDQGLRRKLEMYRSHLECEPHSLPTVEHIIKFLNEECAHTEDASLHLTQNPSKASYSHFSTAQKSPRVSDRTAATSHRSVAMVSTSAPSRPAPASHPCFACQQTGHKIYTCNIFQNKSPQQRHLIVKANKRCSSCLGAHATSQCSSKLTCFKCKQRHHTLLHSDTTTKENPRSAHIRPPSKEDENMVAASVQEACCTTLNARSTVLLGTTLVKLTTSNGTSQVFRALLDSGSMCDFVTERAAQLLGAPRRKSTLSVMGIAQTSSHTKGCTELNLSPLTGNPIATVHPFHILDKISTDLPRTQLSPEILRKVKPFVLADPTFHLPSGIDVLIGCALLPKILTQEIHDLGPNMPYVVGTLFGFAIMGQAPCIAENSTLSYCASLHATSELDLHTSLQRFWHQEEPPPCSTKTADEQQCDDHFARTHSRDADGRYVVKLPFKANHQALGSSKLVAERRFKSLEHKFQSQPEFRDRYTDFMDDYYSVGHMTKADSLDFTLPHYFLPHHGVLKESSSTTKLRTVFDASSKTSTGISLNDVLLTGRKLQTDICDILLQFRTHNVVFFCDIRQMYRQIKVHPDDHKFQLILWRDEPAKELETFKLGTVTYGMNSSPYLALKTLSQLAEDEGAAFPRAAQTLKNQTYVDDIITGADDEASALELRDQLIQLLKRGGFELRKWSSNSQTLLQALPKEHLETPVFLENPQEPHYSVLGLHWSPHTDNFTFKFNFPHNRPSKRNVLSLIAKIYDPCGFLAPCTMLAKCFMQLLWTTGLSWDESLPPALAEKWHMFVSHAKHLSNIRIPRAFQLSDSCSVELHGFSDASESGYAAVIYVRCQLSNGDVIVRQVIAKTRVSPLKRVTLPRLELCAVHLLGQLVAYCMSQFSKRLTLMNTFLWCDSTVVLTWLQTPPYRLKTYVANRVAQTQEIVPSHCWRHISSAENPADCASRGILASELQDHPLWWTGPKWLRLPHHEWPSPQFTPVDLASSEETKTTPLSVLTTSQQEEWDLLSKFSSWTRLQYVTAYILRFVHNCRHPDKQVGPLSAQEMKVAKLRLLALVQQSSFKEDINLLKKNHPCSTRLQRLAPFLDSDGLLHVGGRLSFSNLSSEARHPVILPKQHHVVDLIIDHAHRTHLHAGAQLTQALLARHVWILSARSAIRSRIFKCVKCFRNKPRNQAPLMGELPHPRVNPARPFLCTGIDYSGPFTVKVFNLRAVRHVKVYLCIFICMVTKAVHLEVATDLTTDAFIATLTRFVSRRGICSDLFSDCGTNFVGANTALRKLLYDTLHSTAAREKIHGFTTPQGINFHFNPPAAPHQGGLWESAVKSAKRHLRRVMGETVLTLMEFMTLSTQIEAMLNSRPLTPLSNDPADVAALTPGHFLIGTPLAAVPEPDLHDVATNRLKQWQLLQAFHQRIWRRWEMEYLHTLQQRTKWTMPTRNLQVGDLVLVHANSPPLTWPLARITLTHPGADGVVRTVTLKTQSGTLTRPAVKVFPLPLS